MTVPEAPAAMLYCGYGGYEYKGSGSRVRGFAHLCWLPIKGRPVTVILRAASFSEHGTCTDLYQHQTFEAEDGDVGVPFKAQKWITDELPAFCRRVAEYDERGK